MILIYMNNSFMYPVAVIDFVFSLCRFMLYFSVWSLSLSLLSFSFSDGRGCFCFSHMMPVWQLGLDHNYDEVVAFFGFVHDFSTEKDVFPFSNKNLLWKEKDREESCQGEIMAIGHTASLLFRVLLSLIGFPHKMPLILIRVLIIKP